MYTIFKIYPASGRPDRVVETKETYEEAYDFVEEESQERNLLIREGSAEETTFRADDGTWYFL
jgi:hypothetical protein